MHVRFYIHLPISVTVSIFIGSAFIVLTLVTNISIPQHIIISLIHCSGYKELLKTLQRQWWWDTLPCCYDLHRLNTTFVFLGLTTYLNAWRRFTVFSTDDVSGVKNLNTCVLDFCVMSVVWSVWFHGSLYDF